jgi:outer membrane protein assembly factor BamB
MATASRWIGVIVGSVVLIGASCVFAQDWPQWRGCNRDGKVVGFTAPQTWPQTLAQKWKIPVGSGDATPALVGDKLYVFTRQGDDETVLCLNAADGQQIWKGQYAAQPVTGAAGRHPGPRSSPAVAEGKVVTLGVGGVLSCWNAADGKLAWRNDEFKAVPTFFTAMSPIIVDGMCIAQLGGRGEGAIVALDLATGQQKWRWSEEGPEYASPALLTVEGTKQVVTLTEKSVVGVGVADGKLLWRLPFVPVQRAYNAATPIVDGQTVIYTGASRGTKAVKIEKQGDGFAARELWSNPDLAPQYNTPVLQDGLLFGFSNRGLFFCLNAQTGQTAWVDDTSRDRGGFGTLVSAGSVLLALPSSAELIAFKPSDKKYEELARIKVADGSIYAFPVIAGKRIYVKDQDSLALLMIE